MLGLKASKASLTLTRLTLNSLLSFDVQTLQALNVIGHKLLSFFLHVLNGGPYTAR